MYRWVPAVFLFGFFHHMVELCCLHKKVRIMEKSLNDMWIVSVIWIFSILIVHKTLMRPVLLCGSKTWVLTKREENQLLVFERKVLWTTYCPKIKNGVYRRRYNHKLDKEFDSPNAKRQENKQIPRRWSLDQKTRRPTTKNLIQRQPQWKEKSRKTEIQVGGWGEQR
jgi:hypothetical protein